MNGNKYGYTYEPEYVHDLQKRLAEAERLLKLFHRNLNGGGEQLSGTEHFDTFKDLSQFLKKDVK